MKLRSPWVLMPVILALALVLAASQCSRAADFEQRALPQGYSCSLVVRIVREIGERAALAAAYSEGWSTRQIQAARRCVQQ